MIYRKYTVAAVVAEHSWRAGGWSGDPDGTYEASLGKVRVLSDHAGGALQEIRNCRDAIGRAGSGAAEEQLGSRFRHRSIHRGSHFHLSGFRQGEPLRRQLYRVSNCETVGSIDRRDVF